MRREFVQTPAAIVIGTLRIDTNAKKAQLNGYSLSLPRKEYAILEYLAFHKNQVISAEQLVERIWDNEFDPFSNALRYHICSTDFYICPA